MTCQVEAHVDISPRYVLIQPAAVVGSSTILKRIVSLANNWMFEPILFIISLRYNKKRA